MKYTPKMRKLTLVSELWYGRHWLPGHVANLPVATGPIVPIEHSIQCNWCQESFKVHSVVPLLQSPYTQGRSRSGVQSEINLVLPCLFLSIFVNPLPRPERKYFRIRLARRPGAERKVCTAISLQFILGCCCSISGRWIGQSLSTRTTRLHS